MAEKRKKKKKIVFRNPLILRRIKVLLLSYLGTKVLKFCYQELNVFYCSIQLLSCPGFISLFFLKKKKIQKVDLNISFGFLI